MLAGSRQFLKYAAFVGLSRQGRRAYISGLTGISDSDLLMTCLIALSKKKDSSLDVWPQRSKILYAFSHSGLRGMKNSPLHPRAHLAALGNKLRLGLTHHKAMN